MLRGKLEEQIVSARVEDDEQVPLSIKDVRSVVTVFVDENERLLAEMVENPFGMSQPLPDL